MNRYVAGALGGTLATVPMTIAMVALFYRLPRSERYPLPPREITQEVTRRAGRRRRIGDNAMAALSLGAHFAYGALTGALYPALDRHSRHPVMAGSAYGVAVWAASYLGWIPALRILRPATEHPAGRRRLMIGVHLVWGAGTALIAERLARRGHH